MKRGFSWLIPQEKKFFDMLENEAENVLVGAKAISELLNDSADIDVVRKKVEEIEHRGDDIVHEIFEALNTTFITPIDHEDISKLASALDDVLDHIHSVTRRLYFYNIKYRTKPMKMFIKVLLKACEELNIAVKGIRELKKPEAIEQKCVEVNTLENEADEILNKSIVELLKVKDAIEFIKLKEIYDFLEIAMDRCEDAANVISDIVVKHH